MYFLIALFGIMITMIVAANKGVNVGLAFLGSLLFWPGVLIYALCVNKRMFKSIAEARMWVDAEYPDTDAKLRNRVAMFMVREVHNDKDLMDLPKRFPELNK